MAKRKPSLVSQTREMTKGAKAPNHFYDSINWIYGHSRKSTTG